MSDKQMKRCLVISIGPVPTPQYQTVEGGGMRAWGLAKGLAALGNDVTVAVNASFPQKLSKHDDISLVNWSPDENFAVLLNSFDTVIASYCMGSDSVFIAENINDDVQLILDCYVPIYVEVSAREAKNLDDEFVHYMADVARYNHVLKRGDYFLCASESQKTYYTGVLSSLGIINPRSYREDRIIIAPFGIHDEPAKPKINPYKKLGIKDSDFLVLWFGGLYPWFKVDELLEATKELSNDPRIKFAIVGGRNPFNPNPAFSEQYDRALKFADDNKIKNKSLFFVDWVDFDERINWYGRADAVISINNPGEENILAWRTRVMDYVWGELPIITNGGDPLSEQLLAAGAAIKIEKLSREAIVKTVKQLADSTNKLQEVKKAVVDIKPIYFWPRIMKSVSNLINAGDTPSIQESAYRKRLGVQLPEKEVVSDSPGSDISLKKPLELSKRAFFYARRKGLKRSAHLAYTIGKTQLKRKVIPNPVKKYIFISHPIDNSGAPKVLIEMVEEFAYRYGAGQVRVIAPGILPHLLKKLRSNKVSVEKAALALTDPMIDLQLGVNDWDFLLMNTLAIYPNYRDFVLRALDSGRIKHAYWFIHEDTQQIPFVARDLSEEELIKLIAKQVMAGRLSLLVPSKQIKQDYEKLWGIKGIEVVPLRVDVPHKYKKERPASNYSKLNFLLSGSPADARKGQLLALSAFYFFLKNYSDKNPKNYRPFSLYLLGIGDDYVSQQIKAIGSSFLGEKLKIYPSIPHAESLEITFKCNAVICCSLNETFGLYVAEGMFMGHVLLRNDSAGMEEQLRDGQNGLFIDGTNIEQFAGAIEMMLNKKKFSDEKLQKMGKASQKIIKDYAHHSYVDTIEKIRKNQ